ncbi:MAG: hypothetical protein KDI71_23390 [Xanthomonadales bacterium]|nr:hypothetical protein [Xanthomonadales bacterium]
MRNPYGELNIRSMPAGAVGLVAAEQHYGENGPIPQFDFSVSGEQASLEVRYPDGAESHPEFDGNPGRVDIALFVPDLANLNLETVNDRIQVKRYAGSVTARSTSGNLIVSAAGALDLRTASGNILAMQIHPDWKGQSRLQSDEGLVNLLIPEFANARLESWAQRSLNLDLGERFSISEQHKLRVYGQLGEATGKQPTISVSGGDVHIRKLVLLKD